MKRKFIALAIAGCFVSALSQAQIRKGSTLIGGSAGYSAYKADKLPDANWNRETKFRSFSFSPSFGIAIKDNLIVGADILLEGSKEKYADIPNFPAPFNKTEDYKNYSRGGGVFVRKYWGVANKLYVFGQGRLGVAVTREDFKPYENSINSYLKGFNVAASVYPGLSFAVSRKVHLESTFFNLLTVEYSKKKYKGGDLEIGNRMTGEFSNFRISSSFDNATAFTLGVRVLLSK
jgi:hypothetical protein